MRVPVGAHGKFQAMNMGVSEAGFKIITKENRTLERQTATTKAEICSVFHHHSERDIHYILYHHIIVVLKNSF